MHYHALDDFDSAVLNSDPIQCKVTMIVRSRLSDGRSCTSTSSGIIAPLRTNGQKDFSRR
jgi:hypothetical protein